MTDHGPVARGIRFLASEVEQPFEFCGVAVNEGYYLLAASLIVQHDKLRRTCSTVAFESSNCRWASSH
jgi:hypothetical protein